MVGLGLMLEVDIIPPPIEWIENSVDLSKDTTSASSGFLKLDPYQVEPVEAQFLDDIHEVVVMAPPQTGKSVVWRMPMLYKIRFIEGPRWIIYESNEKADDINAQQFEPLIMSIPEIRQRLELAGRNAKVKRQYRFPTGPVDFSGAGSEPTSKPERDGVADELDTWPVTNGQKRKTLNSFRDRFITWWMAGQGCLAIVSSPNGEDSAIGEEYEKSSRGHWFLRCLNCEELTIASHKPIHLQWDTDDSGEAIACSIRCICPDCSHEHTEDQATEMNRLGGYTHDLPGAKVLGYQWGALASPRTKSWEWIAAACLKAGHMASPEELANFAKTVEGLPLRHKSVKRDQVETIKAHIGPLPNIDEVCGLFFSADTQDNSWYWVVRSLDIHRNTHLVAHGNEPTEEALMEAWDAKYLGKQCVCGIIDEGGHRTGDIVEMVKDRPGLFTYKGDSRVQKRWKYMSEDKHKTRLLANPKTFQSELLYYIYTKTARDKGNYWFISDSSSEDYREQVGAVQPNRKVKNGHLFENWTEIGADHYFDAEKMLRTIINFAEDELKESQWLIPPPWIFNKKNRNKRRKSSVNM